MIPPVNDFSHASDPYRGLGCLGVIFLICSAVIVIFGLLAVIQPSNFPDGLFFSNVTLGPIVEGSFCLVLGSLIAGITLGRAFSPSFRSRLNQNRFL